MAAQYKTQCPHCGAQFKIGEQHLRQARGAVRCGSCLQVFQATDHLLDAPARPAATPPAANADNRSAGSHQAARPTADQTSAASAPASKKKRPDDESWAEALLAKEAPPERPAPPPAAPAQQWTLDDDLASPGEPEKPSAENDDEEDHNDTRVSLGGALELSDSFLSLDEEGESRLGDEDFTDMSGAGRSHQGQGSDESWAEALLQELEEEDTPPSGRASGMTMQRDEDSAKPTRPRAKSAAKAASKKTTTERPDAPRNVNPLFADDHGAGEEDSFGEHFDDDFDLFAGDADLAEYEPEPARPKKKSPPVFDRPRMDIGQALKWGALSLAAMLVLSGQYLVFNFDRLARTPEWRPLYANACGVLGCTLPNPSDTRQLRGANLVVRTHSSVEGALVVDAILYNHAHYEQPFPILELSFSSLRGQPVASRRFTPEEYLRGELAGMHTMPRDVPIRVSFEILNPGADAESYRLYFHPAPGA